MLAGLPYHPGTAELDRDRLRAQSICQAFNATSPHDLAGRERLLGELFGKPVTALVRPPFFCDYGYNIELGANVFINVNCVILDTFRVSIGARTLLGPGVQIYAAQHPMDVAERRTGTETGRPVTIEDDVWIGGGAIICPGVTIGRATVIGAGSVVTRSLPAAVFAAGNPCRIVRNLT